MLENSVIVFMLILFQVRVIVKSEKQITSIKIRVAFTHFTYYSFTQHSTSAPHESKYNISE